jgi:predicted nucleotidyltransferase
MDEYAVWVFETRSEVDEIVVFGSFASGTYVPGSDLDVFLLLSQSQKDVWSRIPDYLPGAFPVGLDLFPYTRAEVEALRPSPLLEAVDKSDWRYRRD